MLIAFLGARQLKNCATNQSSNLTADGHATSVHQLQTVSSTPDSRLLKIVIIQSKYLIDFFSSYFFYWVKRMKAYVVMIYQKIESFSILFGFWFETLDFEF